MDALPRGLVALAILLCVSPFSLLAVADPKTIDSTSSGGAANHDSAEEPPEQSTLAGARSQWLRGDYDAAVLQYQAIIDQRAGTGLSDRDVSGAQHGIARCYERVGRYEDAERLLVSMDTPVSAERNYLLSELALITGRYAEALERAADAVKIDSNHAGARLLRAKTLEMLGRRDDAIGEYRWFDRQIAQQTEMPSDAAWLTDVARGFLRYSVLTRTNVPARVRHVLHEMLQPAYGRIDRLWWPARIAAAELLRERFNNDESDGSVSDYSAALRINQNLCEAHVGLGEIALEAWSFEQVEERVEKALAVNPHFPPAFHLQAKKLLVERRYAQATEICEKALAINPRDVIALSIIAAAGACRFDASAVESRSLQIAEINPRSALFNRILGDALSGIRQYADSEQAYRRAIEYDPTDANARTELGMMYMQWGWEDKARTALDGAWALDQFNERTKFTLELLDQIEGFARVETEHFIIRYDAKRDPGLGGYMAGYLEDIHEEVIGDYEVTLADKTIVEFFPTHRAFGVRITGKPWIHTVGACTGRVIALDSPRRAAELMGPYNVVNVLKHEYTHTITLAATRNRIPHWFTEGLAVYQEDTPRAFEWWKLLADASRRSQLFSLESINWGFMRPRRPNDRQLAYAQSEWMCEFIVERFGFDVIDRMLRAFHDGDPQERVLQDAFTLTPEAFDTAFRKWARAELEDRGFDVLTPDNVDGARLLAEQAPEDAALQGRLAKAAFDAQAYDDAATAAERALELDERERNGLTVYARILAMSIEQVSKEAGGRAREDEAKRILQRLLDVDPEGWLAPGILAGIAMRRDDHERAARHYRHLQRLCPMDPASWRGLAGIYLSAGDDARALPQLVELARIEGDDPQVPADIARICRKANRLGEARYWMRRALAISPFDQELHRVLGETCMREGDTAAALREFKTLIEIAPDRSEYFEGAAFAAHKLGDVDAARRYAERAVALEPASRARALLTAAEGD